MAGSVSLAVDLGTSHTVAVVQRDGQLARPLLFDGSPLLPSGVFVGADGVAHTGRDAVLFARGEPERFEPHPKRRVDEGSVLLGEAEVPVSALLAAVLRRVARAAEEIGGAAASGRTVLTCPADWGRRRREVLLDAARQAGLGDVTLVEEPIAAALYCLNLPGAWPAQRALLVFDFGGGTLDLAVINRDWNGPRVLATDGLDDLGGLDLDSALVEHLGAVVAQRDPGLWQRLNRPASVGDLHERQAFWTAVRSAKEMLSRTATAPVHLPGAQGYALHLTRAELEHVVSRLVDRAVAQSRAVAARAGVRPAGILLVGGSSRLPLVASRLHAAFGIAPTVPEQPELPVALGALLALRPPAEQQAAAAPASGPPGALGGSPSWPAPVPVPVAARPGRSRRGGLALVGAGAVVLVLVSLLAVPAVRNLLFDRGGQPQEETGARSNGAQSNAAGPDGQSTGPAGGDGPAPPEGYAACDVGVPGALCPTEPRCYNGIVDLGVDFPKAGRADCAQPHYWQAYVAAYLPTVPEEGEDLTEHPTVTALCRDEVLAKRSASAAETQNWDSDFIAQESGDRILIHCLAGKPEGGEWTGSAFRTG